MAIFPGRAARVGLVYMFNIRGKPNEPSVMHRQRFLPFSFIFALALAACSQPALPPLSQDAVILAFGDSLTSGSGAAEAFKYPRILSELTGRTVINAGVPGEMSAEGLARLPEVLNEHSPDLLVLIHGGNDLLRKTNGEQTRANLETMLSLAKTREISVVMLGVPARGLFLSSADFYADLAEQSSTPIDTRTLPAILSDASLKSDLVHPNADGYRVMAEAVYRLLADHGAL